jgi:hypothetical protein
MGDHHGHGGALPLGRARAGSSPAVGHLPRADRLAELLHWSGKSLKPEHILEYVDWENEEAVISKIETGRLWFRSEHGEIGPVEVPQMATEEAQVLEDHRALVRSNAYRMVHPRDGERVPGLSHS